MELPLLDWDAIEATCSQGQVSLLAFLEAKVPKALWTGCSEGGHTLLHYACIVGDVGAAVALLAHGLGVNACTEFGWTPAHVAAMWGHARVLEVLCAAGADLNIYTVEHNTFESPLGTALDWLASTPGTRQCVYVLLINGARIASAHGSDKNHEIHRWMVALETGRIRCRLVIVTLLGLKRRRGLAMQRLDRFVVVEFAICVWATRGDTCWQERE